MYSNTSLSVLTFDLLMPMAAALQQDMEASEIGSVLRHPAAGPLVKGCVESFPYLTARRDCSGAPKHVEHALGGARMQCSRSCIPRCD